MPIQIDMDMPKGTIRARSLSAGRRRAGNEIPKEADSY